MISTEWSQKAILISGAAGGVGSAVARELLGLGARVAALDRDSAGLRTLESELDPVRRHLLSLPVDVRDAAACASAIDVAARHFGRIDGLVNCAGVWVEGDPAATTEEEWDRCIDVNLKGTYFMCSRAIPYLKQTRGSIVNIASDAGLRGNKGAAVYCASKGGVVLLTKALALDLAEDLVRVNAVCPSDVRSPMLEFQATRYGEGDRERYFRNLLKTYPQHEQARFIEPAEVAVLVIYLLSEAAQPFTGAALCMDFGASAGPVHRPE